MAGHRKIILSCQKFVDSNIYIFHIQNTHTQLYISCSCHFHAAKPHQCGGAKKSFRKLDEEELSIHGKLVRELLFIPSIPLELSNQGQCESVL